MDFSRELSSISELKIKLNEPLKNHTTIGVGGKAQFYVLPKTVKAVLEVITLARRCKVKYKILGNGSNIIFSDNGFSGVIISLKELNRIYFNGENLFVGAGVNLVELSNFCIENSLTGIEELSGIPGTVGGAIFQNASAFNKCITDNLVSVNLLDNEKFTKVSKDSLSLGYRHSNIGKRIILSAEFKYNLLDSKIIKNRIKEFILKRQLSQPKGKTCGSIFINPKGYYAGELIERANLKGYSMGNVAISSKHANFIINNNATARDVYNLVNYIKQKVYKDFNVLLKEEVEFVGEF